MSYHRLLGRHAPTLRRAVTVLFVGFAVTLALIAYTPWQLAVVAGFDTAVATFLVSFWHFIGRADSPNTKRLATREDKTKSLGNLLLVAVCVASLFGVGFTLGLAGDQTGAFRKLLIAVAVATVALSWTMVNTIYTLRYADLYYRAAVGGIAFGDANAAIQPTYRDFAYVAFTVGMTYQVSDTALRDRRTRRAVLTRHPRLYLRRRHRCWSRQPYLQSSAVTTSQDTPGQPAEVVVPTSVLTDDEQPAVQRSCSQAVCTSLDGRSLKGADALTVRSAHRGRGPRAGSDRLGEFVKRDDES